MFRIPTPKFLFSNQEVSCTVQVLCKTCTVVFSRSETTTNRKAHDQRIMGLVANAWSIIQLTYSPFAVVSAADVVPEVEFWSNAAAALVPPPLDETEPPPPPPPHAKRTNVSSDITMNV
jgi:hypothetical protein